MAQEQSATKNMHERAITCPRSKNPQYVDLPAPADGDALKRGILEILTRHNGAGGSKHFFGAASEIVDASRIAIRWNVSPDLGVVDSAELVVLSKSGEVLSARCIESECWPFWDEPNQEIEELAALLSAEVSALREARRILRRSTPPAAVRRRAETKRSRVLHKARLDLRRQIEEYACIIAGVEASEDEAIDWSVIRGEVDAAVGEIVCELVMHQ